MQRLAFQERTLSPGYAGAEALGISTTRRDSGSRRQFRLPERGSARNWSLLFLQDMQLCCIKVLRYSQGLTRQQFLADEMLVKQIPPAVRERHPQLPWRRIAGLRDVLAHAYFGLEEDTIWQIVSESIPALADQLNKVVEAEL